MTHRPILAVPALFSGVALLLYLIGGVDLRLALGATIAIATGGGVALMRGASPSERRAVARAVIVGALAGVIGTAVYDGSRAALSALDPSPFNPFHAIHAFGELLVGPAASEGSIVAAGTAFHLLNGTMFAIAYTFLFARDGETSLRRALASGLIWGLFLETFQITLYPGWLDIRAYNEFLAISPWAIWCMASVSGPSRGPCFVLTGVAYCHVASVRGGRPSAEKRCAMTDLRPSIGATGEAIALYRWMWPAWRLGRLRPGLRAATASDAARWAELRLRFGGIILPALAIALPLLLGLGHLSRGGPWTYTLDVDPWTVRIYDVFTESIPFMVAAAALGMASPAAGVLLVGAYGVSDLLVTIVTGELQPLLGATVGRFVSYLVLWLLVVEVPLMGRLVFERISTSDDTPHPRRVIAVAVAAATVVGPSTSGGTERGSSSARSTS